MTAVAGYLAVVYKRTWRASVVTSFVNPLFFLLAMGVGLGSLVDHGGHRSGLGGVSYLAFVAPALLATTGMQTGAFESAWPVHGAIKYTRTFHAMLTTPLTVTDLVAGQLAWVGLRLLQTCTAYLLVMTLVGGTHSAWGVLAVGGGVLTGLAFAAPLVGLAAKIERESTLVAIQRFGLVPLFLFSGTFFPVSQLPGPLPAVAYATPLWHGVDLCRRLALGHVDIAPLLGHVAYLAAWIAAGTWFARRALQERLLP